METPIFARMTEGAASQNNSSRIRTWASYAIVFVGFLAVILALRWGDGTFRCELADDPDEPAHFVTGLMVREYIAGGLHTDPMAFATDYYLHYPKVAIGHWPPFFYALQAAWMLVLGPSRNADLLLMAALAALLLTLIVHAVRREFGWFPALFAASAALALRPVEVGSREVMTEMLMAVLVMAAVYSFGRFVDTGRALYSVLFGLIAGLALLSKGSGIELALVPPLTILFTGKWDVLRRPAFWAAGLVTIAVAGPWYKLAPGARHESVAPYGAVMFVGFRLGETPMAYVQTLGPILLALACLGIVLQAFALRRGTASAIWASALGLILSSYVFRSAIAAWGPRHLITGMVQAALFTGPAVAFLLKARAPVPLRARQAVLAAVAIASVGWTYVHLKPKTPQGFETAAAFLEAQPSWAHSVLLVGSDPIGEGAFISEIALRERQRQHIVLRSTKVLGESDWMGVRSQAFFHSDAEVTQALEEIPVGLVLIDMTALDSEWSEMLRKAMVAFPERWKPVALPEAPAGHRDLRLFRLVGHEGKPVSKVHIHTSLGRDIGN